MVHRATPVMETKMNILARKKFVLPVRVWNLWLAFVKSARILSSNRAVNSVSFNRTPPLKRPKDYHNIERFMGQVKLKIDEKILYRQAVVVLRLGNKVVQSQKSL